MMTARHLQGRAETFALDVLNLCATLPTAPEGRNIRDQLGRAATAVAANYRATCRARSRDEFIAKLGLVVEEADEAHMWLQMIGKLRLTAAPEVQRLEAEANELTAIFVASRRTAVSRHRHRRTT